MCHARAMHSESPACLCEIGTRFLVEVPFSRVGFRFHLKAHATQDTALQQLAPALVPCLMRKLAPQLSAERLDVMLLGCDPQPATCREAVG